MTPAQIDALNPGDVLADPKGPDVWFVHRNLPGREGLRIMRHDSYILSGRDMMVVLRGLRLAWANPAPEPVEEPATVAERVAAATEQERRDRRRAKIEMEYEESLRDAPAPTAGPAPRRRIRDAKVHQPGELTHPHTTACDIAACAACAELSLPVSGPPAHHLDPEW